MDRQTDGHATLNVAFYGSATRSRPHTLLQ